MGLGLSVSGGFGWKLRENLVKDLMGVCDKVVFFHPLTGGRQV
jgi:hypothetical protein